MTAEGPRIHPGTRADVGRITWAIARISGRVTGTGPTNLFLTLEYRRLWTTRLDGRAWAADHINIGGGIAF